MVGQVTQLLITITIVSINDIVDLFTENLVNIVFIYMGIRNGDARLKQ